MRAKDFLSESDGNKTVTINIPINITIPAGGGDPVVAAAPVAGGELPPEPTNVFPLQQELELLKHKSGKTSKIINQIVDDNGAWSKANEQRVYDVNEDYDDLYAEYNRHLEESQKK